MCVWRVSEQLWFENITSLLSVGQNCEIKSLVCVASNPFREMCLLLSWEMFFLWGAVDFTDGHICVSVQSGSEKSPGNTADETFMMRCSRRACEEITILRTCRHFLALKPLDYTLFCRRKERNGPSGRRIIPLQLDSTASNPMQAKMLLLLTKGWCS